MFRVFVELNQLLLPFLLTPSALELFARTFSPHIH